VVITAPGKECPLNSGYLRDPSALIGGILKSHLLRRWSFTVHRKIRKRVSVSGFLHSHWIGQLILN
ncbi:hypothetical protein, partial [Escherichia coli]|uniref:hypothetical protein n=1 Tax=Escherichia coli TaxID=562 RepID=UPI000F9ED333